MGKSKKATEKLPRSMTLKGEPSLSKEDTNRSMKRQKTKLSFTRDASQDMDTAEEQKQTDEVIDTKPGRGLSLLKKLQSKKKGKETAATPKSKSTNATAARLDSDDALSREIDLEVGYRSGSPTPQPHETALAFSNTRSNRIGSGSVVSLSTERTLSRCFAERIWTEGHYDAIYVEYIHSQNVTAQLLRDRPPP